jgi:catechol 2,3-dioxygenase-like lactoylglutathione lyase family enzyme
MRGWVHHIDLTVSSLERSGPFYEAVLGFLGYRRGQQGATWIDWDMGEPHCASSIAIRAARTDRPHDRYSCGLHHLAWVADSRDDVDRLHALLVRMGATILDVPADYPDYRPGYYALFFADPDGLKLEFVHTPPSGP